MSQAEDTLSTKDAQKALEKGDNVTEDELHEMHKDLRPDQIYEKIEEENAALELESHLKHPYEKPRSAARQGRKTFNTGPKGVLTDYEEAKLKLRARRIQEKIDSKSNVYMKLDTSDDIRKFQLLNEEDLINQNEEDIKENKIEYKHKKDNENESDGAESDEEIMMLYKLQKLEILEKLKPSFGSCMEVTAWTFDKEVENEKSNILIVMHIYQDYIERCSYMNAALSQLAEAYPHVKFLRARSDRIGLDDYPDVGLPTIVIWKGGKQIHNFIAVTNELPNPFTSKNVESWFIEKGILQPHMYLPNKPSVHNKNPYFNQDKNKNNDNNNNNNNNNNKGNKKTSISSKTNQHESDSDLDIN